MVSRLPRVPDLISRRELLFAAASLALLPPGVKAAKKEQSLNKLAGSMQWPEFQAQMTALAAEEAGRLVDQMTVVERGMQHLTRLDVDSVQFREAVDASYETGNRYWMWQRMIKQQNINGGILNISSAQLVQLHDHPGATGLLRIIAGEAEVWQFDVVAPAGEIKDDADGNSEIRELIRVSHAILKPGDTAVLTPEKGNIHALRALSKECKMLDFFIPPYQRSQRSWYVPSDDDWSDRERIFCRKIAQDDFMNV